MPRRAEQKLHKGGLTANYYTTSRHNAHPVKKSETRKKWESKAINVMNKKGQQVNCGKIINILKYDLHMTIY